MMMNEASQGFRLSPQQRQAWAAWQAGAPASACCAVHVEGALRAETLEAALRELVKRHEILRTGFPDVPGMKFPLQVINDGPAVAWESVDLKGVDAKGQQEFIGRLFEQSQGDDEGSRGDDARGACVRASLLELSDERHVLFLSLPALAADARTLENLTAELAVLYAARGGDADDPVQYVQFSAWQNELLEDGADAEEGRAFWGPDATGHAAARLPFELPSRGAGFKPARITFDLDARILREADELAEQQGATSESVLLAGWYGLLWHMLRQERVVVGRKFDGRKFEELRAALGLYDAELPVPAQLEEGLAFGQLVRQVADRLRDGERWQEYFPWPSGATQNPCAFGFEYAEAARPQRADGAVFTLGEQRVCASRFKVKLRCVRRADRLAVELHYDASLFRRADIERLGAQYARLLGGALADPRAHVSRLRVLGDDEQRRLLEEFNDTRVDFNDDACFHQLFEAQAARTPDAAAVADERGALTYGELNRRANRLAHYLRSLGVGPESRVALLAERSTRTVVGVLSVLKAGGAYVPLDPALPPERLASMLRDSGATVLLRERQPDKSDEDLSGHPAPAHTTEDLLVAANGGARSGATLVCFDADAGAIAAGSEENLRGGATAANLAYVIYTSGSTGQPKGVAIEHGQLTNYVHGVRRRLDLPAPASYAVVSTFAADLGHTMAFPALASGGTLHVISHEMSADAVALADYFTRHGIDCLKIVPSHLAALLAFEASGRILPRQRLILGGEAAPPALAATALRLAPGCRVFNHYGPTETTVGVLTHEVVNEADGAGDNADESHAGASDAQRTLPIGRAIPNLRVYVLDADLRPVPFGAAGELYVAGAGLARGYLNHAAATADKFIPDPFSRGPGARLYRTGDMVRFLPEGPLEFLGRRDHQVKIRGYRIELGEVEMAVRRHAGVREAVVVARGADGADAASGTGPGNASSERRIVAYVVAQRGQRPAVAELRAAVNEWLPEYMTPSAFVLLDKLPLTPNGKIDLRALPSPDDARPAAAEYVAPRTDLEEVLSSIWAEVLEVERVGVHDNFFELGGHSLLAMRITSRLREIFRVELQLRVLFEATTVEELARAMTASETKPGQFESVAKVLKKIKGMSADGVRETLRARKL
jgi:amino acid adenylation domain-containing protein